MTDPDSRLASDSDALGKAVIDVLARSTAMSLSPPEIAQAIGVADWHALLAPMRKAAVALASEGRLVIYRKGKIADAATFSGVYRIGLPRQD